MALQQLVEDTRSGNGIHYLIPKNAIRAAILIESPHDPLNEKHYQCLISSRRACMHHIHISYRTGADLECFRGRRLKKQNIAHRNTAKDTWMLKRTHTRTNESASEGRLSSPVHLVCYDKPQKGRRYYLSFFETELDKQSNLRSSSQTVSVSCCVLPVYVTFD